jgi:hypothetical protein
MCASPYQRDFRQRRKLTISQRCGDHAQREQGTPCPVATHRTEQASNDTSDTGNAPSPAISMTAARPISMPPAKTLSGKFIPRNLHHYSFHL